MKSIQHAIKQGATGNINIAGKYVIKTFVVTSLLQNIIKNGRANFNDKKYRETRREWHETVIIDFLSKSKVDIVVPGTFIKFIFSGSKNPNLVTDLYNIVRNINVEDKTAVVNALKNSGVSVHDIVGAIPKENGGQGKVFPNYAQGYIFIFSPLVSGNGYDVVKDPAIYSDSVATKEFLLAVLYKFHKLHDTYGIIHEDAKLTNILYKYSNQKSQNVKFDNQVYLLTNFPYSVYLTDFEWSESLRPIYGYEIKNSEHYNSDENDINKRPMVPEIRGYSDTSGIYRYGNWNHGLLEIWNSIKSNTSNTNVGINKYIKDLNIVPRCFAIDSLCLVHASFTESHIKNTDIQRLLHQWFAEFKKASIDDSEVRHHGKVDYADVEAKGFAKMIIESY